MSTPKYSSCNFHEPYFGASYPDACCIEGRLWDLDSCDKPGGQLSSGGEVPCPQCCHDEWLKTFEDEIIGDGWEAFEEGKSKLRMYKAVRWEQPQDAGNMQRWFEAGWKEAAREKAAALAQQGGQP